MQENSNRERFKNYLRKIGSGEQTGKGMTRAESADALNLILHGIPSPAQIGGFMIAHRIRRPEPQELAGMLDTYIKLGPKLISGKNQRCPICFGMPFDGRNRTSPIYPLTTLLLISAGQPVILQGGRKMPVKYGVTSDELFQSLGLNLKGLTIDQVNNGLLKNDFAFMYQPDHFLLAESLIPFRDEIGKRPPIASMELLWTAHQGSHLLISGFVHTPTEDRHRETMMLINNPNFITVKGLEGSTDIPISKACITGHMHENEERKKLILNPKEYGYSGKDIKWNNLDEWQDQALLALEGKGSLAKAFYWNAGIYLWFSGISPSLEAGLLKVKSLIHNGIVKCKLNELIDWREKL
tara:strand:- start:4147 stop:5205 length:1059 start_codon:yes stop_codon:yes gene_type:complete